MIGQWHEKIPHANPTIVQELGWDVHRGGRQVFAGNYARGGAASIMFAHQPKLGDMMRQAFRKPLPSGDPQQIARLQKLQKLHPGNKKIGETIKKLSEKGVSSGIGSKLMGAGMGAAMMLGPAFSTEGPIKEKARAVTAGAAGYVGWEVGSKAGLAAGATLGSMVLPGIGTAIGGAIGFLAGGMGGAMTGEGIADAVTRIPDRFAESQSRRRKLNWAQGNAAFNTEKAYTMRQHSMMAMNRGHMSARSLMGQESVFMHQ